MRETEVKTKTSQIEAEIRTNNLRKAEPKGKKCSKGLGIF